MKREEAKELLPIMQAFVDGKKIEFSNDGENWIETETPTWDTDFVYRIKPKPEYRPFKTAEECWNEMHKHPDFGWIKNDKELVHICNISKTNNNVIVDFHSDIHYSINVVEVFYKYTFIDGAIFGVKED